MIVESKFKLGIIFRQMLLILSPNHTLNSDLRRNDLKVNKMAKVVGTILEI